MTGHKANSGHILADDRLWRSSLTSSNLVVVRVELGYERRMGSTG